MDDLPQQGSKVFIFKNGYCFIVKKLEIPPNKDNAPFEIVDLPGKPVYGSFSIQTTSNSKFSGTYRHDTSFENIFVNPLLSRTSFRFSHLKYFQLASSFRFYQRLFFSVSVSSIQTKKVYQEVRKKCTTTEEMIKANLNRPNVELLVQGLESNPVWLKGKIQSNAFDQDEDQDSENAATATKKMVIIEKTDGKTISIPASSVVSVQGENLKTTFQERVGKYCFQIYYKSQSDSNGLAFVKYLTYGVTWIPSYE